MEITKEHIKWANETLEGTNEAEFLGQAARRAIDNSGIWRAVGTYLLGLAIQQDLLDPDNYDWKADTFFVRPKPNIVLDQTNRDIIGRFASAFLDFVQRDSQYNNKTKQLVS